MGVGIGLRVTGLMARHSYVMIMLEQARSLPTHPLSDPTHAMTTNIAVNHFLYSGRFKILKMAVLQNDS
jgi:hypothetical protein